MFPQALIQIWFFVCTRIFLVFFWFKVRERFFGWVNFLCAC